MVAAVQKEFAALGTNSLVGDVQKFLPAFVGAKVSYLVPDLRPIKQRSSFDSKGLSSVTAWKLASLVSWLFVNKPVGDPVRAGIPAVVKALQGILADKRTNWELEGKYYDEEKPAKRVKRFAGLVAAIGGKPVKPTKSKGTWTDGRDDGTLYLAPAALEANSEDAMILTAVWTAKLDSKTIDRVTKVALAASDWEASDVVRIAAYIRSDKFASFAARVAKTDVPKGSYEADPRASAPALVGKVAAACKVSGDAAALLLQTITLPDPSKANVLVWNGWTSDTYEAAAAELLAKKLVVQAKVDGAGRKIFGPGPVIKKTKLNAPIESSKLALIPNGRHIKHLLPEPCHVMFARAWEAR